MPRFEGRASDPSCIVMILKRNYVSATECPSEDGFAGVGGDGVAGKVAEADHFLPLGLGALGSAGINWRGERQCDGTETRKNGAIAQHAARTSDGDGNDGRTGVDCCFKGPELKGAQTIFRNKSAFGKDENGFAIAQKLFHFTG